MAIKGYSRELEWQIDLDEVEKRLETDDIDYLCYERDEDAIKIDSVYSETVVRSDSLEIEYWAKDLSPEEDELYSVLNRLINKKRAEMMRQRDRS